MTDAKWFADQAAKLEMERMKQKSHEAMMDGIHADNQARWDDQLAQEAQLKSVNATLMHEVEGAPGWVTIPGKPAQEPIINSDGTVRMIPTGYRDGIHYRPPTKFMHEDQFQQCEYRNSALGTGCPAHVLKPQTMCSYHRQLVAHLKATGRTELDVLQEGLAISEQKR